MRLTLLGASRAEWLLLRDSGLLPSAPTTAQATEALRGLHRQWLCGTESRSVGSTLDNLALYVKLVARHSLPSRTICEHAQKLVSFGHVQLPLAQWHDFVNVLLARYSCTLHDELLFALPGMERFLHTHQLRENWFDARLGASFLDNPANEALLAPWRHWLLAHVDSHLATSALTLGAGSAEPHWHKPGIRQYLQPVHAFLRRLLLLIHMTAGLPARKRKLVRVRCCNTELLRNLFICKGYVMLLLCEHGQQRVRFLPAIVSDLLLKFLVLLQPLA